MSPLENDLDILSLTVDSTVKLLITFKNSLEIQHTPPSTPPSSEPLEVLSTTAILIHAHTTKLVLLLNNQPFTPSAICTILRELSTSALPAMMAATEAIDPRIWTKIGTREIKSRVRRLLTELVSLVQDIPQQHQKALQPESGQANSERPSKDSFASTGVVWDCCDSIKQLKSLNLAGIAIKKAEEWKATLQDALSELKEWSEDVDSDEDDEDDKDEDSEEDGNRVEDILDNVFGTQRLPKREVALGAQLDQTLKKLRLIDTLYAALIKRRLKTVLPPKMKASTSSSKSLSNIEALDRTLEILGRIPENVDELIGEYYELHSEESIVRQDKCISLATSVVKEMRLDWEGKEDIFTVWSEKWLDAIGREKESNGT